MSLNRKRRGPIPWRVHPIWRGIGLILVILLPIISYGLVEAILESQAGNSELARTLRQTNPWGIDFPVLKIGLTIAMTLVLFLIFSIIGSVLFSLLGGRENEEIAERTPGSSYRR